MLIIYVLFLETGKRKINYQNVSLRHIWCPLLCLAPSQPSAASVTPTYCPHPPHVKGVDLRNDFFYPWIIADWQIGQHSMKHSWRSEYSYLPDNRWLLWHFLRQMSPEVKCLQPTSSGKKCASWVLATQCLTNFHTTPLPICSVGHRVRITILSSCISNAKKFLRLKRP